MQTPERHDGVPPPPRALFWLAIGVFALAVTGVIAGLLFASHTLSMSMLLELGLIAGPALTILTIAGAVLLRKRLPRLLPALVIAGWIVLWLGAGFAFISIFRNNLAPGQRETVKHYLPFMEAFAPPLPAPDASLPTPESIQDSGITAEDLLGAPLTLGTPVPTRELPAAAPAEATPTLAPTATATTEPPMTATPAGTATTVAILPTSSPAPIQDTAASAPVQNSASNMLPVRPSYRWLTGFTPVKQGWNNCGPANITMALSYYGWTRDQEFAASYLKPDREDKNVNPWELVAFVNENSQVRALTRIGGDMELLKQFISHGLPVIIETGYMPEGYDWIGHYQTVVGFDDTKRVFYVFDSYLGTGENGNGLPEPYDSFDSLWQGFNRTFVTLYKPDEEGLVRTILGDRADVQRAAEIAADTARSEARANPQNGYTWFNLGSSLTRLGQYQEAAAAFDKARQVGVPWRITLYQFGPFEAYYQVGRFDEVLSLVDISLNNGGQYVEETYYWQGMALAAQGATGRAATSFRQALARNPRFDQAKQALAQLAA